MMCTDKSNKFTITDRETYKAMGAVHTARDRKIGRNDRKRESDQQPCSYVEQNAEPR